MKWQPIEELEIHPRKMFSRKMFVVRGSTSYGDNKTYRSDPYCVWWDELEGFVRWPHPYPPTEFCYLPE